MLFISTVLLIWFLSSYLSILIMLKICEVDNIFLFFIIITGTLGLMTSLAVYFVNRDDFNFKNSTKEIEE